MKRSNQAPLVAILVVAWLPSTALAQAALTEQHVQIALMSPAFKQSLASCFGPGEDPAELVVVVRVSKSGQATLVGFGHELAEERVACVAGAVEKLPLPATGKTFELTLTIPAPAASAPQVTATAPVAAEPAMKTKVAPGPAAAEEPPAWRLQYSKGKKRMIAGAVTLGGGFIFGLIGGAGFLATTPLMCDSTYYTSSYSCRLWIGLGATFLGIGTIAIVIGAVLLGTGSRIKKEALASKPVISLGPGPGGRSALLGLRWRF